MSSLNLKRACSTKQTGSPGSPSGPGSEISYWLMTGRMRWRRTKRSCWFGSTVIAVTLTGVGAARIRDAAARAGRPPRTRLGAAGEPAGGRDEDDVGVAQREEALDVAPRERREDLAHDVRVACHGRVRPAGVARRSAAGSAPPRGRGSEGGRTR